MSPMKTRLISLLLALAAFATPLYAQSLQPLDRIAAIVDEDVILQSELERAIQNVTAQYANQPGQLPPRNVLERQVLERLVLMKIQSARAADTGIRVSDEELNAAVAAVAQQNQMSIEGLQAALASDGISFADFRNSVRDEITVQRLRQSFAQSRVQVSEAEVDAALKSQSTNTTRYQLAHVLVSIPDGATAEQISTGQQKIDGIKGLIDRGEMDFAAAAVRYSDSPNALEGGDLGWRSLDEIPTAFSDLLKTMSPGQVAGPLRGPSGFQLLKLVAVDAAAGPAARTLTEYQARHILIRVNEIQDNAAAKAKIDTLRARVAGGADFAEVAREASEDANSRSSGGDLGWFPADAFGPDFGQQVTQLADNGISAPFRSEAGWHVLQRTGSRQTDVTDATQRAQVREMIGRRKLEDEYNRYLRELRSETYVNFRTGDRSENADDIYQPAPGSSP